VKNWLPAPESAVLMDDFEDLGSLASFLRAHAGFESRWKFHRWRTQPAEWSAGFRRMLEEDKESLDCRICRAVALDKFAADAPDLVAARTAAPVCTAFYSATIFRSF
jgi:hypothetical protein